MYFKKSTISGNILSIDYIKNLNLIDVNILNDNAFWNISSIANCNIYQSNNGLSCYPNIFRYEISSDEEDSGDKYVIYSVKSNLRLFGSSTYEIYQNSFTGVRSEYLSIDLSSNDTVINEGSFASAAINIIELKNIQASS